MLVERSDTPIERGEVGRKAIGSAPEPDVPARYERFLTQGRSKGSHTAARLGGGEASASSEHGGLAIGCEVRPSSRSATALAQRGRARGDREVIASLVRFRSRLSDDEVRAAFVERAQRYFDVPGLVEKIYLRFRNSGEFGALYVWESESALEEFERNALARTIGDVYRVEEVPISELADVCLLIRPKPAASHEAGTSIRAEGS